MKGWLAAACVAGCERGAYPEAVVESEVVRKIGAGGSISGGDLVTGVVGFDFAFPMRKKSKNVVAAALGSLGAEGALWGAKESGDGFECAGGRK